MSKQEIIKIIGTKFYVWFLTLAILIIGVTLILVGDHDHMLSERIIGGLTLTPLARPLWIIFNGKLEKQDQDYKLNKKKIRNDRLQIKNDFKLEKLRIKSAIIK